MNFADTNCCAIQEITGLSTHNSGDAALEAFCRKIFVHKNSVYYKSTRGLDGTVYSFYLFTASVAQYSQPYGQNFYDTIKKYEIGEVWQSPKVRNNAFHADHSNQVYIWMPDYAKLKAWWTAFNAPKTTPVAAVPDPVDDDDFVLDDEDDDGDIWDEDDEPEDDEP